MKYFYDLHIHTSLSPCADILMSPNNILNMAYLKELNIIAITDHNSCLQCESINKLVTSYNMLVIYGAEISVKEGYHVLCLFPNYDVINDFQDFINNQISFILNDEEKYGEQIIFDENDDTLKKYPLWLLQTLTVDIPSLYKEVHDLNGIMILAHIEKYNDTDYITKYNQYFDAYEINVNCNKKAKYQELLKNKKIFYNSDAHQITDILEKIDNVNTIELNELTSNAFFQKLRGK